MTSLADENGGSVALNASGMDSGVSDRATRGTFLSLFIIIGFVGNSVLIATVAQSSRLKNSTINLCIVSLAVANILDSGGNMAIILGVTITENWDYGQLVCHLNAFGLQLISIAVVLGLMLLVLDRFVAVLDPAKHKRRLSVRRMSALIGFFWMYSIAFSIPLMLDSVVPIKVFPVRYLCTITNNTPLLYLCLTSIFCFLIPIGLSVSLFVYIIKRAVQLHYKERQERLHAGYVQGSRAPDRLWEEIKGAKFAGVMFILWLILQAPYLVLSSIMWYRNSRELIGNKALTDLLYFEYPWELELSLTWLKLSYPMFLPLVTFLWKKHVWTKLKNAVLCRKSNVAVDASPAVSPPNAASVGDMSNGVPVLFATEDGLHFQTYNDDDSDDADPDSETRPNATSQVIVTKKCDVYGSQFLQLDDEDTSDYDSSGDIDPFSNSNPVSVRTEYGQQNAEKLVDPEGRRSRSPPVDPLHSSSGSQPQMPPGEQTRPDSAKANVKKKKRRQRSDDDENIIETTTYPEDDLARDNPCLVTSDADDPGQVTERTSHDSGMGSLGKSRKAKKHRKNRVLSEEATGTEDNQETQCRWEKIDETGKVRKCKKKQEVGDDIHRDSSPKRDKDDTCGVRKQPDGASSALDADCTEQPEREVKQTTDRTKRPTAPSRKVNAAKCVAQPRETNLAEVEADSRPTNLKQNSGTPQRKPSRHKVRKVLDCEDQDCCHGEDEVQRPDPTNYAKDKSECSGEIQTQQSGAEQRRPPRKKRKHKSLDREARQRKLAEELDQEIQGVLY